MKKILTLRITRAMLAILWFQILCGLLPVSADTTTFGESFAELKEEGNLETTVGLTPNVGSTLMDAVANDHLDTTNEFIPASGTSQMDAIANDDVITSQQPGDLDRDVPATTDILDTTVQNDLNTCSGSLQLMPTDPLQRAKTYMNTLGIESISDMGTVTVRADANSNSTILSPGIHVLQTVDSITGTTNLNAPECWTVQESILTGSMEPDQETGIHDANLNAYNSSDVLQEGSFSNLEFSDSNDVDPQNNLFSSAATNSMSAQESTVMKSTGSSSSSKTQSANSLHSSNMTIGTGASQTGGSFQGMSQSTADVDASTYSDVYNHATTSVVRYEGEIVSDVAVIIAKKVVFEDAELILSDSVPELFIIAETIESSDDSTIRWIHAGTAADPSPAIVPEEADDGFGYEPYYETSGASFDRRNGENGDDGDDGTVINHGLDAPDVYIIIKTPTVGWEISESGIGGYAASLPQIDVRGQDGGLGQRGQDGGDGGDGAKGLHSEWGYVLGVPVECNRGAGWGGHGGDGGDGGDGGSGGDGGDGGVITVYYVDPPVSQNGIGAWWGIDDDYLTAAGSGADGGSGGSAGAKGIGGDPGDPKKPYCREEPGRAGNDGEPGDRGDPGPDGLDGTRGDFLTEQITLEEWEEYFTKPWLISATSPNDVDGDEIVTVVGGDSVTFNTLNISGSAELFYDDEYDNSSAANHLTLVELGNNQYRWDVFSDFQATRYLVWIERPSDSEISNTYRIEVIPRIDELVFGSICTPQDDNPKTTDVNEFVTCTDGTDVGTTYLTEDPFEARLGGWAHIVGSGLRADSEVIYDGESLGRPVFGTLDSGLVILSFKIPILSTHDTFFAGDEGDVEHSVYLEQPWPLLPTEEIRFTLLKNYRLTFEPSVNGFEFSNAVMTPVAKTDANQDIWQSFREVYGPAEIDGELLTAGISITAGVLAGGIPGILNALAGSTDLWGSFLIFSTFWSQGTASAMCTGMTGPALDDYFAGMQSQNGVQPADVAHSVMLAQSRVLSEELLDSFWEQMLTPSQSTEETVDTLVAFLRDGSLEPSADAPMLIFIPTIGNIWDFGQAHTVAPYQVVYTHPDDELPSRIYIYDNNAPASSLWFPTDVSIVDRVVIKIEEVDGDVEFKYTMLNGTFSNPYRYTTGSNWILGHEPVDSAFGEASLPIGYLYLIP